MCVSIHITFPFTRFSVLYCILMKFNLTFAKENSIVRTVFVVWLKVPCVYICAPIIQFVYHFISLRENDDILLEMFGVVSRNVVGKFPIVNICVLNLNLADLHDLMGGRWCHNRS